MDEPAIIVKGVSKEFVLLHNRHTSLKQAFVNVWRHNPKDKQHALKGISFEVKKGEFFGIVGRNGSGKSTLLKILAGVYTPNKGGVIINGKLTPFIELGVGFNPEVSGRDNVFLNGALLGFSHKEMAKMYDEIVEFAELEKFMDQKLKNYSSGMQVRLAFSIAIRVKSDILLIDEVLAVGDAGFQAKCFNYFKHLKNEKQTVVFVSHDMESVRQFCDRAMLIDKGVIKLIDKTHLVAAQYAIDMAPSSASKHQPQGGSTIESSNKDFEIQKISVAKNDKIITPSGKVKFIIRYSIINKIKYNFGIAIMKNGVSLHERNTKDITLPKDVGEHALEWGASASALTAGIHTINVTVFDEDFRPIAAIVDAESFLVEYQNTNAGGLVDINSQWSIEK